MNFFKFFFLLGLCWWRYEDGDEDDEESSKKFGCGDVQLDIVDMHDLMVVNSEKRSNSENLKN